MINKDHSGRRSRAPRIALKGIPSGIPRHPKLLVKTFRAAFQGTQNLTGINNDYQGPKTLTKSSGGVIS